MGGAICFVLRMRSSFNCVEVDGPLDWRGAIESGETYGIPGFSFTQWHQKARIVLGMMRFEV
jgi:hypothetical protein